MSRVMPKQKPGKSETIVRTPPDFLKAVKRFLGIKRFDIDLAACADNAASPNYFTKEDDALTRDWWKWIEKNIIRGCEVPRGHVQAHGWCWLNPPYDHIEPWARKCYIEGLEGVRVAMLVPASVGSNWWEEYVHEKARVYYVKPRLSFLDKGGNPILDKHGRPASYPKDLALVLFGDEPGTDYFRWRNEL